MISEAERNLCIAECNFPNAERIFLIPDHTFRLSEHNILSAERNFRLTYCNFRVKARFFLDAERNFRFAHRKAMEDKATPSITLAGISRVLGDPSRWAMLRELGKGEPLPVSLLARRIGISQDNASKHMAVIRRAGIAQAGLGRLYSLAPAFRPAPGATHIDFGHCLLRLPDTGLP